MSGKPYRTIQDMATSRAQYMANLKLMAELDDKNYQANKTYLQTGQLPSQLTDTRSVSEKLADVERLKIELQSKLLKITDGYEASKIVQNLTSDQLVFLSQNFGPIQEAMKKLYSVGVLADIFIDYLNRYIDNFNQNKGVDNSLQQTNQILANTKTILDDMATKDDINRIIQKIQRIGKSSPDSQRVLQELTDVRDMIDELPLIIDYISKENNAITKNTMDQILNRITNDMVTKTQMEVITNDIEIAIMKKDLLLFQQLMEKLQGMLMAGDDLKGQIELLKEYITQSRQQQPTESRSTKKPSKQPTDQDMVASLQEIYTPSVDVENMALPEVKKYVKSVLKILKPYLEINFPKEHNGTKYTHANLINKSVVNPSSDRIDGLYEMELTEIVIHYLDPIISKLIDVAPSYPAEPLAERLTADDREKLAQYKERFRQKEGTEQKEGSGMKGRGITPRKYTSEVLPTDVDHSKGIKASAKFVPMGRHLININQLNKDIVAIKRQKGSVINTLPSQRVTRKLGGVLRKIVGGGIPTFDELNDLDDDEKLYLSKVANETQINNKLSIPTPRKTSEEQDINQFEILRGQILSGQDNPEVVRKFKSIILKLSNKNLIPKAQVRDLLLDLATLGH